MNEVKHIHIGRQQFTVSVEAYGELTQYLQAITKSAGKTGADVAEEVELRMAELLTERGVTAEKVILPKDVAYLKSQLGEPSDFSDDEAATEHVEKTEEATKRLFRDTDNAMIAGVAAGLAKYLDIDPIIIRIIFITLVFAGGSGVLIYLLLWLLVPEAKSTSDRLSMEGKATTVENLKQIIERADVPGATRRANNFLGKSLGTIGKVLLIIVGLPLVVGASAALLGIMAMAIYVLMDGFKVAGQVIAPLGGHEVLAFLSGTVAAICMFLAMLLVGIAMIRRRWQVPAWGVAALFGIFFVAASAGGALSTDVEPAIRQRVEALHHTKTVQLSDYRAASLNGPNTDFRYIPDGKNYVLYDYYGTLKSNNLRNEVQDGVLRIDTKNADPYVCNGFCPGVDPGLNVEVHGPKLTSVTVNGQAVPLRDSCELKSSDTLWVDCPAPPEPAAVTSDNS